MGVERLWHPHPECLCGVLDTAPEPGASSGPGAGAAAVDDAAPGAP